MARAWYNDNDPKIAAWLRDLVATGSVAKGDVDERSIENVQAEDVEGYGRCHFFAGIGGWDYALDFAGWPDDEPVWTGSCPCQPFSTAGRRRGTDDPRHLWPVWRGLVAECRPATVFGEQVASPDGREWLAGVRADLEDLGYAVGGTDLCAASVGAPHRRQRLYWVADAQDHHGGTGDGASEAGTRARPKRRVRSPGGGAWDHYRIVVDHEDARRRIGLGVEPVAYGFPRDVVLNSGYGNSIVPQAAAEFVRAYLDVR